MIKKVLLAIVFLLGSLSSFCQADKVVGYWQTENGKGQIQVYKTDKGQYYGKIVWLKSPNDDSGKPCTDSKNANTKLQKRLLLQLNLLSHFTYNVNSKEWENGTIYDPESGSTYKCFMWFENNNFDVLFLKGYVGFSFIGRTSKWKREQGLKH